MSDGSSSGDRAQAGAERYCPTCDRSFPEDTETCSDDGTRLVRLAEAHDPMIGKVIDSRFTVREKLGAGGMGAVYRAWQASVGREVAIKVIHPRHGGDRSTAKRFLREAKLSSQLAQPNTVMVIDFGQTEDGTLYLVMELLRGKTLASVLRRDGRFSVTRMMRIATQMCDALEAAHGLGIVHRDLKPSNVMVLDDPPGRDLLKVLDFGLAKAMGADNESLVTQSDRIVGTPSYLAPEATTGGPADERSDLYSMGVMLFELVTGRLPFSADNVNMMVVMHAYQPVPELGAEVPAPVAEVIRRLLAKKPEARYPSAAHLRAALEGATRAARPDSARDEALSDTLDGTAARARPAPDVTGDVTPRIRPADRGAADAATPVSEIRTSPAAPRRLWIAAGASAVIAAAVIAVIAVGNLGGSRTKRSRAEATEAVVTEATEAAVDAPPSRTGKRPPAEEAPALVVIDAGAPTSGTRTSGGGPVLVTLTISARPDGEVFLDGTRAGAASTARPLELDVPRGVAVQLEVRRAGYKPWKKKLLPTEERRLDAILLKAGGRPPDSSATDPGPFLVPD